MIGVVVLVHGGPESQFVPGFNAIVQFLVHHRFAVVAPNIRGSTGYGKTYVHLDDVEKRLDSVCFVFFRFVFFNCELFFKKYIFILDQRSRIPQSIVEIDDEAQRFAWRGDYGSKLRRLRSVVVFDATTNAVAMWDRPLWYV